MCTHQLRLTSARPYRYGFGPWQSHRTRHGSGALLVSEYTIRNSTTSALVSAVFEGLSTLLCASSAPPVCDLMALLNMDSSSRSTQMRRWVLRDCPRSRQARRSDTPSCSCTCRTLCRRRSGLGSFPWGPRWEYLYLTINLPPTSSGGYSLFPTPLVVSPGWFAGRRTLYASGNNSAR